MGSLHRSTGKNVKKEKMILTEVERYKKRRANFKLIGALMPLWFHAYLSLYCLAKGHSKAMHIKIIFNEWASYTQKQDTEEDLLHELIERINRAQRIKKVRNKKFVRETFMEDIKTELLVKGLPEGYIKFVLSKIE